MKKILLSIYFLCPFLLALTVIGIPEAGAQEQECRGNACVDFGEAFGDDPVLPLEKAMKTKVDKRRHKEKEEGKKHKDKIHSNCAKQLDLPPADRDEEKIQKFCNKSPGHGKKLLKNDPILTADGKKRGKKIKTRTTLTFEKPGQRYGHEKSEKWVDVIVKPPKTGDLTARNWRGQSNSKDKKRNRKFLDTSSTAKNDDQDCYDSFTGEHLGGVGIENGSEKSCFEFDGTLKGTLTAVDTGGCKHNDGTFFPGDPGDGEEDDCYDRDGALKNTLVELIDEDGPSPDEENTGDGVYDIDGDGLDGEDPPETDGYAVNDDNDCIDVVTSQHLRGAGCFDGEMLRRTLEVAYVGCTDAAGDYVPGDLYDNEEDGCYYADGSAKDGMTPLADGCRHGGSGTFFEGDPTDGEDDDCYDAGGALKTTLAELIDEDDGLPVDDDDDGFFDEDGLDEPADFEKSCHAKAREISGEPDLDLEGIYTADGGCNLTRPLIVKANKESMADNGKKAYKADQHGRFEECDDKADCADAVEYGTEPRSLVIEEDLTVLCDEGTLLDEPTGQCIPEEQEEALRYFRVSLESPAGVGEISLENYAMMGFTFSPPRLRWGLFYKETLDLWFFTLTLFEAKVGFDFGMGVGFRLPMEVTVSNVPASGVMAQSEFDLASEVLPENFSADDYETFCLRNDMGNDNYCRRFSFPNALDPDDGDELAIRMTSFAGIKVVILSIPLVNWGIDVDMDLPEMCSLYLAYDNIEDVAREMVLHGVGFAEAMRSLNLNCGSYTTPYGLDDRGNPLQFPFIQNAPFVNKMIRADCAEAFVRGETVKLPDGEIYPLCTGLILGIPGVSLGLGVGVDFEMSSNLIEANASVDGDGIFKGFGPDRVQALEYHAASDGGSEEVAIDRIRADNYDDSDAEDYARLLLDDFTYCLNEFSIRLKGQAMFGGILTIFPDFPDFTIYRLTMPGLGCGIPIGQHADTRALEFPVFVENYGLEVEVGTDPSDPNYVNDKTLRFPFDKTVPGGDFLVSVKNIGSVIDDFDNFRYDLSNERDQTEPYSFVIDPDNDGDGQVDEDDFGPAGLPKADRDADGDGMADEDPPDDWQSTPPPITFKLQKIEAVPPHTPSSNAGIDALTLKITPFIHPSTSPGLYPFRVKADSSGAAWHGLATVDPSSNYRFGAADVAFVEVDSFYDPQVVVVPVAPSAKPGVEVAYLVEGTNMGNTEDTMSVNVEFLDFNEAGCTLTNRGKLPGCPFRAEPTVIQGDEWTTRASLAPQFGPLEPLGTATDTFSITVPGDWEGIADTIYRFEVTTVSLGDDDPPASNTVTVQHQVIATKESMVRYIRHEIHDLVADLEEANAQGIRTGGLLPIALKPVQTKIEQALELILAGRMSAATNALSSNIKVVEAFVHALDGYNGKGNKIPAELDADWHDRAAAIIADLQIAAASEVASASGP